MRVDFMTAVVAAALAVIVILYTYITSQHWIVNYDTYAWVLAEKTATLLSEGKGVDTNAYIVILLILPNGTISHKYTIGTKPLTILGRAYTYRILSNNTLLKVEVWVSSTLDYVRESP